MEKAAGEMSHCRLFVNSSVPPLTHFYNLVKNSALADNGFGMALI